MCINNDDFYRRVNYIAQSIATGHTGGKKFLECFDKGDSEFIITALFHKVVKNEKFENALQEFTGRHYDEWLRVASEHYSLNKRELKEAAIIARNKNNPTNK
jgi:hypothetical protein